MTPHANNEYSPLEEFDSLVDGITYLRGDEYGHPADDFDRIAKMKAALPKFDDPRFQHIAEMFCVKLSRLSSTPNHIDSLVDIAGYARTWAMILERMK